VKNRALFLEVCANQYNQALTHDLSVLRIH